jgi:hypothetical protein
MNRKIFIQKLFFYGIGISALPLSQCNNRIFANKKMKLKGTTIIIGAGASGLYAGYLLDQIGASFKILEAQFVGYICFIFA